jgi:peptidoglycan hydrolase-like protein with peptidoglycan-binding domain
MQVADVKVLEAQQWVNATYSGVSGYEACLEDGITGWGTMYSLIMGLQSELGISPVVANFGPGTTSRFAALGGVGEGWDGSANIVRILQYGLFCKGYWSASSEDLEYGFFSSTTRDAVDQMRENMGLPPNLGIVDEKIARCILNMDAYVIVADGSDKIRTIQQWLNGRYHERSAYTIGPCDGIYSRDVQKSLMIGLQYELELDANGNFGPGTQAGLREHLLSEGDSGIFVELFSSACVFNEPVVDGNEYRTERQSTYGSSLTTWVTKFQKFSQLTENGNGDYPTWAQLLVSMGDPDRPASGCDTRFEITPTRAQWLVSHDYKVIGRYIYDPPDSSLDKEIKPGELDTIFGAGLRVLPIFQDNGRQLSDFTFSNGRGHGFLAHSLAQSYGFNRGTVIYFAVDYDATQAQIESAIIPYFQGVSSALSSTGSRYLHGVYGSRNVCSNVTASTFARHSFVSGMSWGFSGNLGFQLPRNWSFNQIKEIEGIETSSDSEPFDLDRDVWRDGSDPGVDSVNGTGAPMDEFITDIEYLYQLASQYENAGDRSPDQLVMEYIRTIDYSGAGFWWVIGPFDTDFAEHVEAQGRTINLIVVDPISGYELSATHMMATANAVLAHPLDDDRSSVNLGDVGGWAGDLMTFWADWRNSVEEYANPRDFCAAKLAQPNVQSSYGFADFIEDADGFLLADRVLKGGRLDEAVADHFGATALRATTRFEDFVEGRWGSLDVVKEAAHTALVVGWPAYGYLDTARLRLIVANGAELPELLPFDVDDFEEGFVDAFRARLES